MTSQNDFNDKIQRTPDNLISLCRIGGIAALILVVYSLATMVQMVVLGGQPTSAAQAFDLLQHHRVIGLLRLDLPTIISLPLYYLVFLAVRSVASQRPFQIIARDGSGIRRHNTGARHSNRTLLDPAQRQVRRSRQRCRSKPDAGRRGISARGGHLALHRCHRRWSTPSMRRSADLNRYVAKQHLQ